MTRIPAERRQAVALDMQGDYYAGSSIRNLVAKHGYSYGTVHSLLLLVKTKLRPRGGDRWRPPAL